MLTMTFTLNNDGSITVPDSEQEITKLADWCKKHKRGIIIGHGACEDEAWQHIHFMEHAAALDGKKLHLEKIKSELSRV